MNPSFLLFATLLVPRLASASGPDVFAVVVANNYAEGTGERALRFADDDGARYFELFRGVTENVSLFAVLDPETQRVHADAAKLARPPRWSEIEPQLSRDFAAMQKARDEGREVAFYFIYAGHGGVADNREGFVHLLGSRLTKSLLFNEVVARSPASTNHLIIDSCDSYFMVASRGQTSDRIDTDHTELINAFIAGEGLARFPNTGVVVSTSTEQETHEWSRYGAGVFSHEVRSALIGAADINQDGRIEYSELKAFVAAANANIEDPKARVSMYAMPPRQNLRVSLFEPKRMRGATLVLTSQDAGRYYLEDARGVRYADFNKSREVRLAIALLPSSYYFVRGPDDEARVRADTQENVRLGELRWQSITLASRGSVSEELSKHLFKTPYGPTFYHGFVASSGDLPVEALGVHETVEEDARIPWRRIAFGVAAGGAVGASVFAVLTARAYNQLERDYETGGVFVPEHERSYELRRGVMLGFVSVFAAAAGAWFFLPATDSSMDVAVIPTTSGGYVGVRSTWP